MKQDAFLERRQRVDVLHVGGPAIDRGDDAVNVLLGQRHQRQQIGCDVRRAGGDAVGRHVDVGAAFAGGAKAGGEFGHRWRFEQPAHRHIAAQRFAQARGQLRGQQRMATQLEEVVAPAHGAQIQHGGPLSGNDFFKRVARCFGRRVGGELGRGQRFAIDLAVGIERQARQHHEGRRHHVGRQARLQRRFECG